MLLGSFPWRCEGLEFWPLRKVLYMGYMCARANWGWRFKVERSKRASGMANWDFWTSCGGKASNMPNSILVSFMPTYFLMGFSCVFFIRLDAEITDTEFGQSGSG